MLDTIINSVLVILLSLLIAIVVFTGSVIIYYLVTFSLVTAIVGFIVSVPFLMIVYGMTSYCVDVIKEFKRI